MEGKIPYRVEIKKKKHSSGVIKNGEIVLRISSYLPEYIQKKHITELLEKLTPLLHQHTLKTSPLKEIFLGHSCIPWDGIETVLFHPSTEYRSILKKPYSNIVTIKKQLRAWATETWKMPIETILFGWKNHMNLSHKITSLTFKHLESKWGMCSHTGEITLAIKTLFLPYHLFEYVLVHEIAHLKHMNHSSAFWRTVESVLPHHKSLRKELRQYH